MRTEVSIRPATGILTASLAVVLLAAVHPCAAAAERGKITLRGAVLGASGLPLENAWVFTKGSRRVSALTGPDGSYTLEIPGGTVAELLRQPLKLRIEAQRKGWWIRLADGQPELLLELRLVADSTDTARLRVRSSDPKTAAALAEEAVLAGAATGTLEVNFRAVPEPSEGPRKAKLTAVQEVVLNGIDLPPGQPTAARSGPIVIPTGLRAGTRTSERNVEAPERSGTTPEMIPPPNETPPAPPPTAGETQSAKKPAGVAPVEKARKTEAQLRKEEQQRKKAERAAARERAREEKRMKKEARAKKNGRAVAPAVTPPQEPAPASGSSPRVYRPAEPPHGGPLAEPRVYNPAEPRGDHPPEDGGDGPRVYRPAEAPAHGSSEAPPPEPRVVRESRTSLRDSTSVASDTAATATSAAAPGAPAPTSASPPAKSQTAPAPAGQETEPARRSARVPAGAAPPDTEPNAWCTCRVEGFVEVQSEQRMNGFLRVRVWLEHHPEIRGEVELFMGSPRSFVLRSVPCGPHRIRFETMSKQSFDLVSPEPKVDCTDGGVRQVRLVLEPSKRHGR